ncbi:HAD family hydrolase [Leptospira sp. WS39.C2]
MSLNQYKIIFWDFDGVIKDSVHIKTKAYLDLFPKADAVIKGKIKDHHLRNGGISRFVKIPLYLEWNEIEVSDENISKYLAEFANIVTNAVIQSDWIPGVEAVISQKLKNQVFVIVTGTPQNEIESIVEKLNIADKFDKIFGSPAEKSEVIKSSLIHYPINPKDALMIGDSESDFKAAYQNGIDFLFCDSGEESDFSKSFLGNRIKDFRSYL